MPILYSLPKIHKLNNPIRPIVSFTNSPTYNLSSFLSNIISQNINYRSGYSIKNSIHLCDTLQDFTMPPNCLLVSFDISNLFTNVPIPECLQSVRSLLSTSEFPDVVVHQMYSLLELALQQNFFSFNNKTYKQVSGLAMGCPLSPILAEIFLADFERVLNDLPMFSERVRLWRRYVDDIFCVFEGDEGDVREFAENLNIVHPNIKFTFEVEVGGCIPFLDIKLFRDNHRLQCEVYRKPTTTSHVIPFHSQHPLSYKLSSFNSYFYRLLRLPLSTQSFEKELNLIYEIAKINHFPKDIISQLLQRCKRRVFLKRLTSLHRTLQDKENKKYFSIPFLPCFSQQLQFIFKKLDINISFSIPNTLRSLLPSKIARIDNFTKSGVYKLICSCGKCYVGRTFRSFNTRYNEHIRYLKKCYDPNIVRLKSTFAQHVIESNCSFNIENKCIEILHTNSKSTTISQLECLEILIHKLKKPDILLNEVVDFDNDSLLRKIISHSKLF